MGKKMQAVVRIERWSDQAGDPNNSSPPLSQVRGQVVPNGVGAVGPATTAGAKPGVGEVLNGAIFSSQTQEELLQKVRTALRRMQELAALAQEQPRTPPAAFGASRPRSGRGRQQISPGRHRSQRTGVHRGHLLQHCFADQRLARAGQNPGGPGGACHSSIGCRRKPVAARLSEQRSGTAAGPPPARRGLNGGGWRQGRKCPAGSERRAVCAP